MTCSRTSAPAAAEQGCEAMIDRLGSVPRAMEGTDTAAADDPVPPRLRSTLALLASGLPDTRAAQRGGLSARTHSRRVAELMQLLGCSSRFAAGVEAVRRGWL